MIELKVYLATDLPANAVNILVENTLGEMKTSEFRRIGVDTVTFKYLNTPELKKDYVRLNGTRIPSFRLLRDGNEIARNDGYADYDSFSKWLKSSLRA